MVRKRIGILTGGGANKHGLPIFLNQVGRWKPIRRHGWLLRVRRRRATEKLISLASQQLAL
jgi:hypothetical protein